MKLTILIVFLLGILSICNAQSEYIPGNPIIQNFLPEDYNGYIQNWNIIQDSKGIMYIANGSGILEYDGKNWNLYKLKNESSVFSVAIDPKGRLYAGGIGDFGYFDINKTGQKVYVSLLDKIPGENPNVSTIWRIVANNEGVYFFSRKIIYHYHNNQINIIPKDFGSLSTKTYNKVFFNDNLGMLVLKNDTPTRLPQSDDLKYSVNGQVQVLPFKDGKILFVSRRQGLFIYDYNKLCENGNLKESFQDIEVESNILKKLPTEADSYLGKHSIYCCSAINDSTYAFGTLGGGVVVINNEGKLLYIINEDRGLTENFVNHVYADKLGNLWAATDNGISFIQLNSSITYFDKKNNLETGAVNAIRHKGMLYVVAHNACYYLPQNKTTSNDIQKFNHIYDDIIFSSLIKDDQLFAGGNKFCQINGTQAKTLFIPHDVIYSLGVSEKHDDYIFLGLRYGFMAVKLKKSNPKLPNAWTSVIESENIKYEDLNFNIRNIASDELGNLWISSEYNGLFYLKFLSNNLRNYELIQFNTKNGLPAIKDNKAFIHNGNIYVTTVNGIYEASINKSENIVIDSSLSFSPSKSYNVVPKDFSPVLYMNIENDKTYLLSANEAGIVNTKKGEQNWNSTIFNSMSGEFEHVASDKNGIFWFSTNSGLYRYDSKIDVNYTEPYKALIRKVFIDSDSLIFGGNYYKDTSILENNSSRSKVEQTKNQIPVLKYNNNNITFEYSAAFYEHGDKLKYQYSLKGFDDKAKNWTKETIKEYTNLPPGDYSFEVIAKNIYEHKSNPAIYSFTVLPPWYRTILAYISYFLSLIILIYLIVKINVKRLKREKEYLEHLVEARTSEIQLQNQEIQQQNEEIKAQSEELYTANEHLVEMDRFKDGMTGMIVHDLKNPLSTIIGLSEKDEVKQAGQQMLNMVLNILDVQKLEKTEINLQISEYYLQTCIDEALKRVNLHFERKSITLRNLIPAKTYIEADYELMIRVFVNLLTNAIKYTPNNGQIKLQTEELDNSNDIRISVTDTGQGIPEDKLHKVFDKFSQVEARKSGSVRSTGLGLAFCKLAVKAHGGEIGVTSTLEKGSTFWFTVPKAKFSDNEKKSIEIASDNDSNIILENIEFNNDDIQYLNPYCAEFKKHSVYEFSDLMRIIENIDSNKNDKINLWLRQVENAIRACNEEKYIELINLMNNE